MPGTRLSAGDDHAGPGAGQQIENLLPEVVWLERLGDECVGTTLISPSARFLFGMSCENEHRNVFGSLVGAESVENLPAVHLRKTDIENQEIRLIVDCGRESLRTVVPHHDFQTGWAKTHFDQTADHR